MQINVTSEMQIDVISEMQIDVINEMQIDVISEMQIAKRLHQSKSIDSIFANHHLIVVS
jgi:hypothetical protein